MIKGMNSVIKVLMNRDGMSKEEAINYLEDVRDHINTCLAEGSYTDAEEIMYSELGLEMDYIFDVIL